MPIESIQKSRCQLSQWLPLAVIQNSINMAARPIRTSDDACSKVQRDTPRFNKLYAKRIVVEQTFSRLQELQIEEARHYSLTAIRNANTIDYLALALVALAVVKMKKPQKIRCFRTFMKTA